MNNNKIALSTKFYYGFGALGKDFACAPIYIFLMYYFTDVAKISAAYVGVVFLAARIIDAITDPLMGMIVDNTRSKFGKFRPWIVIGTFINAFVLIGLFSTHMIEGPLLYIYAAAIYILWGVTYTIMDIPYWSMIPSLSDSRPEREKLVVWPRIFASFAWFVIGAYGLKMVGFFGGDDEGDGFFKLSLIIAMFFMFSAVVMFYKVEETVHNAGKTTEKFSVKDVWRIISSNDQLKALIATVLAFQVANMLIGGFAIYYFTYALGDKELFATYMLAAGGAELVGVFVSPWLARLIDRRYLWAIACSLPVVSSLLLFSMNVTDPGNTTLIIMAGISLKLGVGLQNVYQTVMLADVVDYGEFKTGMRSESIIFSIQTMLVKAAGALGGFITGIGLAIIGYVPDAVQTPDTVFGLQVLMIAAPALLMIMSALIYRAFYRLHHGFDKAQFETI